MELDRLIRPSWKLGEIIRHKKTGHPYLVQHIYKFVSTLVIDMLDPATPTPGLFILPRNYEDYAADRHLDIKGVPNGTVNFTYKPVVL